MKRLLAIAALLALPARAGSVNVNPGVLSRSPAWTGDGLFVISIDMGGTWAINGRTGQVQEVDAGEVDDFLAKHGGGREVQPSRTSPDGKARAAVKVNVPTGGGKWDGNVFTPASSGADFLVERDGKTWVSLHWYSGAHALQTFWSPDGRRVAWVVEPNEWLNMDSSRSYEISVGTGGGPRVQLLAHKAILRKAGPIVLDALEAGGFTPSFLGRAVKARDKSVVYAAEGFEEVAKKAAAAVPGGATVDKLSWKADAELVVAIGSSALKGAR